MANELYRGEFIWKSMYYQDFIKINGQFLVTTYGEKQRFNRKINNNWIWKELNLYSDYVDEGR